jgi:hypothetical protein
MPDTYLTDMNYYARSHVQVMQPEVVIMIITRADAMHKGSPLT